MKKCAIACTLLFFLSFRSSAQVILDCDFSDGIPTDYVLIDGDGLEPSKSMASYGFAVGLPWIAAAPAGEENIAACSTSWYSPAGQSNDWMILPTVTVNVEKPVLRWRSKASDAKHPDGYAVYLTTGTASAAEDFTGEPVFSVDADAAEWGAHSIDLTPYQGQQVTVAFVNNSTDCSRLYVDDLYIGTDYAAFIVPELGPTTPYQGEIPVTFRLYTQLPDGLEQCTVGIESGNWSYSEQIEANLAYGSRPIFTLSEPIEISKLETIDYTMWVEANGTRYEATGSVTSYPRKVLCEDVTGMWCQYCVRGIVALDEIRENYADQIVGLAVHSGDILEIDGYLWDLGDYIDCTGLPAGGINRRTQCDPGKFISTYSTVLENEPVVVALALEASLDEKTNLIKVSTDMVFADDYDEHQFAISYLLYEDRIHQPGNRSFYQKNGYSGGENGEMGGWEDLPSQIDSYDIYFDDCLRSYFDEFDGFDESVPNQIQAGETINHKYALSVPDNIYEIDNVGIIALLIDRNDHRVVNVEKALLGSGSSSISDVMSDADGQLRCYDIMGRPIDADAPGLKIVVKPDGSRLKIVNKR